MAAREGVSPAENLHRKSPLKSPGKLPKKPPVGKAPPERVDWHG
jgi:hypothetical protein